MRAKNIAAMLIYLVAGITAGCGGGGGGGTSTGGGAPVVASGTVLNGVASKGPVAGGTIKVFEVISSATLNPRTNIPRYGSAPIVQGTTGADGSYSVTIPPDISKGSLLIQITGGSYTDESTGLNKKVDDEYGPNGMRALVSDISAVVSSGGVLSASVTPYTEMAVEDAGEHPTGHDISVSNGKIAAAFNLPDIVGTKPLDANQSFPAAASDDAKKYALALATISQYQKDYGAGATMAQISAALSTLLHDGGLTPDISGKLAASSNNYADGSHNSNVVLQSPTTNPSAPAVIHSSPSAASSSSIGSSVAVSAQVLKSDGTPVADGTLVNFSSSFGTLSAASVATVNGIASVSLSSATPGNAVVKASSGAASDSTGTISFIDPNAPVGMTLSANPGQGFASGGSVLISANVTRQAGGAVPDGTVVNFSILSGSGTLSGATTTVSGIATVSLSSSAAGASVIVKATLLGLSQQVSVPFSALPSRAIVRVGTSGTLPQGDLIGGLTATVSYATGKGLSINPSGVVLSGQGVGSSLIPNTNNAGSAVLGLLNVSGIGVGEFATLTFNIVAGNFPTSADFSIAPGANTVDINTAALPGISVQVLSVTIQ